MKPILHLLFIGLLFQAPLHAQGTNNDFDFDQTDFEFLFSKMGYGVFKFPISQSKDQIFDVSTFFIIDREKKCSSV